jgi:hypothetical protein
MKHLIGLVVIIALGVLSYIAPVVSAEHSAAQLAPAASPVLVTGTSWIADGARSEASSIVQCPNCCEVSEDGTRCISCHKVCP